MSQLRRRILTYLMPTFMVMLFTLLVGIALYRVYTQLDAVTQELML